MLRVVMLGCGTGVGKTYISRALLGAIRQAGCATVGLKPIETGIRSIVGALPSTSDAQALSRASSHPTAREHPLYAFPDPISPHLAARRAGRVIELSTVATWVRECEADLTLYVSSHRASCSVVETAGGVFSPVSTDATNFDLALALEPAIWILVAADSLGVLHDVTATLQAMRARGRSPDHLVLSAARPADESTGTNADELETLGIARTAAVVARDSDEEIEPLIRALLEHP